MGWAVTLFFLTLMRLIALSLSFALSSFAAALFFTFVLFLGSDLGWLEDDPVTTLGAMGFAAASWFAIAQLAFAPSLIAFLFLELGRFSSLTINIIAGGAIACSVMIMGGAEGSATGELPYTGAEIWGATVSAGFISGLMHWLLAGHRAGRWMGSRHITDGSG